MSNRLSQKEYLEQREHLQSQMSGEHPPEKWLFIFRIVSLEVEFVSDWESGCKVGGLAADWVKHQNPYFLDLALVYCRENEIPATSTLWDLLGEIAGNRIDGRERAGTAEKARKSNAKGIVFNEMASMIYHGETLHRAAAKGAYRYQELDPSGRALKASSLEVEYVQKYRKTGLEKYLKERWDDLEIPVEQRRIYREKVNSLKEVEPSLKGERR